MYTMILPKIWVVMMMMTTTHMIKMMIILWWWWLFIWWWWWSDDDDDYTYDNDDDQMMMMRMTTHMMCREGFYHSAEMQSVNSTAPADSRIDQVYLIIPSQLDEMFSPVNSTHDSFAARYHCKWMIPGNERIIFKPAAGRESSW